MSWLVPFSSLTPEQQSAAFLSTDSHRVIVGGPGSGKTLVLLHRFSYLYQRKAAQVDTCRMFVFTTTLKDFIKSALPDVGVPEDLVTTFDKWCVDVYKTHINAKLPRRLVGKLNQPDFAAIRTAVHESVTKQGLLRHHYDFIVVDEGQDLTEQAVEIVASVARHVTVAMDGKQQLYDEGVAEDGILKALRLKRQNVSLIAGFRCNPMVTELAAQFLPTAQHKEEFRLQSRSANGDRQRPLLLVAPDWETEKKRISELMRMRFAQGDSLGILLPRKKLVHGYATGFLELGIDVVADSRGGVEFGDPRPKILTYHEAKGLTFDSVFLPRLDTGAFTQNLLRRLMPMMFVGISRAVRWACLSTLEGRIIPPVKEILSLGELNYVEVQKISTDPASGQSDNEEDVDEDLPF